LEGLSWAGWAAVDAWTGSGFIQKLKSSVLRQEIEHILRGQRERIEIAGRRWS
jgi:hypothetical protein